MRKKIVLIIGLILVFIGIGWYICAHNSSEGYNYGNYQIRIGKDIYCEYSQIGYVEMQIENNGKELDKLLHTSDDILSNGFDYIIDDQYMLQILGNNRQFKAKGYEIKYEEKTQYLKIFYINPYKNKKINEIKVEILETATDNIEVELELKPTVDTETQIFACGNQEIYVTAAGVLFDVEGTAVYNPPYMTAATMNFEWDDKKAALALENNVAEQEVNGRSIKKYKLKWIEGNSRFYAAEFADWKNIKEIKIGENKFERN